MGPLRSVRYRTYSLRGARRRWRRRRSRGAAVADDDVLIAGDDHQERLGRDLAQAGTRRGPDLARHDRHHGPRRRQAGLARARRHQRREVPTRRMTDQREPVAVGSGMARRGLQHIERIPHGDGRVGQEFARRGLPVGLVAGINHDEPAPGQMLDPGAVDARIGRHPAVREHHHRSPRGQGINRLKQPVRPRPGADLLRPERRVRIGHHRPIGPGGQTAGQKPAQNHNDSAADHAPFTSF